jgi:hyperosmotically inducible periplasmic protein
MATRLIATLISMLISTSLLAQQDNERPEDEALTSKVTQAVAHVAAADAKSINVQTRDGVVQLSGFVKSEEARDAALKAAVTVAGVDRVRNELAVQSPASESAPAADSTETASADTVIAARVKSRLAAARLPQGSDVQVEVQDGAVQLSGFVESVESKTKAADVASAVTGVTDVQNNIAVQANAQR